MRSGNKNNMRNTLHVRRAAFARVVGSRLTVTFRGFDSRVECIESGESVSRAMFNWWQRDGWIREVSRGKQRAEYEVVEAPTWMELTA